MIEVVTVNMRKVIEMMDTWDFIKDQADGHAVGVITAKTARSNYQYKLNGKEWQDELGLNIYAMDMRQYDPAIARWIVQDPVIHHNFSPYTAFDNNPVFWADPSGADSEAPPLDMFGRPTHDSSGQYIAPYQRGGRAGTRLGNGLTSGDGMTSYLGGGGPGNGNGTWVRKKVGMDSSGSYSDDDSVTIVGKPIYETVFVPSSDDVFWGGLAFGLDLWSMNINNNLAAGKYVNAAGKLASFKNLKNFKPDVKLAKQPNLSRAFSNYRALGRVTKAIPLVQIVYSEGSYELGTKNEQAKYDRDFTRVTILFGLSGPLGWGMGTFLQINQYIPVQYETPFNPGRTQENWNSYVK